jgi:hypothetical protein
MGMTSTPSMKTKSDFEDIGISRIVPESIVSLEHLGDALGERVSLP